MPGTDDPPKAALDEWEKWARLYEQVVTRRGGS